MKFLLKYGIILLLIPATFTGFFPGKIIIIQTLCFGILLFLFIISKKKIQQQKNDFNTHPFFIFYFIYCIITYLRGFFNIQTSTDWINQLSTLLFSSFLIPFFIFLSTPDKIIPIWRSFLTWGLLLCLINFFYPPSDGMMSFEHNMSFFNVFILCIPYIKNKYKLFIIIAVIIVITYDINRRSILINNLVPFILLFAVPIIRKTNYRRLIIRTFIIIPVVLLTLGLSGVFNIFKYTESMSDFTIEANSRKFTTDSRSGIYEDVFSELQREKAYIWGLGGNGKTQTHLAKDQFSIWSKGRESTESGMLNHIQYGGLIGFLAYGLLLLGAAIRGSNANNDFIKLLSVFISFKFLYSFIEDPIMTNAQTFYLFLWIGMCYNKKFKRMNNSQIKLYLNKIFI